MTPFECYKTYLAFKSHFTKKSFDYQKYCGKSRASLNSFYKRKDRYFFEKTSRQKTDKEIEQFFVANFSAADNVDGLWIGEIIREGEAKYNQWQKKIQSLSYSFKEETQNLLENKKVDEVFDCSKGHPPVLKKFLNGNISLETLVIYDKILLFGKDFDKKLKDPVWETVSLKIKKYSPFLNIDIFQYKKILRQIVIGD